MQTVDDIRKTFLDFFVKHEHKLVDSSPLVPRNDPTLMFTNAGMVQFKNVFTGVETREYSRAVSSQKCIRAGGKHNDLENVGHTARHHTFFEMLGNFSFGDYFKEQAIELAWNLITKDYGIPADRLLATVYAQDDEAYGFWKKIAGLPESRIIRIPTSDNFWAMGSTGPCGPCSEIFYDHGDSVPGGPPGTPEAEGDRFVEVWNLVFMQYEQKDPDVRVHLPRPSVDTGMGLERIAAIMQGVHDNYDIDLLRALIEASAEASNTAPDGEHRISHRVIADHLRSAGFLIADGVLPSNEGRGYVLRRITRRAMRRAHLMGCKDPLLWKLVPALISKMGGHFPELSHSETLICETLKLEEERFKRMLDNGLGLLNEETAGMAAGSVLDGKTAFKLHDTYGFPLDLTQDALRERDITVDADGFNAAMERQRAEARAAWVGSGEAATEEIWFAIRGELGATDFLGYDTEVAEGQVLALVVGGQRVNAAEAGGEVAVILNQTPFYGESGGQMGDAGVLVGEGLKISVSETQKRLGVLHVHIGRVEEGTLKVGANVSLQVDHERRLATRSHHSATHLLHAALRRRLGEHVTQKGSLVAADRLRFDISHPKAITPEELSEIESQVNGQIRLNTKAVTHLMSPEAAQEAGAMALFGEKYGDEVRVVSMGETEEGSYSTELCGGTHVARTGDIGLFKVVGESAVAAGVRRIEAATGAAAQAFIVEQEAIIEKIASLLKTAPADVPARVTSLVDERRKLEHEITGLRRQIATGNGAMPKIKQVNGLKYIPRLLDGVPAKDLKNLADDLKKRVGSGVVALVSVNDGRASLVVGVTEDLMEKSSAVDLVRIGSAAVGGKGGGGRPDMAQAGGPDGAGGQAALDAIESVLG